MRISRDHVIFSMSREHEPVAHAKSGDEVIFETCDCFSDALRTEEDVVSEIDFARVNPATGPLYVEGAEPGDVLKVDVLEIRVNDQGATVAAPGLGRLADTIAQEETAICQVKDYHFLFQGETFPLRKMIGVIGTAPAGDAVNTGTPGDHGGNMDCTRITEGVSLYLPVQVDGARLAMGDLHAAMGDGEIMGAGLEIAGEVKVRVEVLKDFPEVCPLIETDTHWITVGSRETMEEAADLAIRHMASIVKVKKGYSDNRAGMFLSLVGDLAVCQIVNPNKTLRMEVKKDDLA